MIHSLICFYDYPVKDSDSEIKINILSVHDSLSQI